MLDFILKLPSNRWIAFGLYWLPLAFCVFGYALRTSVNANKDRKDRETPGAYYVPRETYGTLIGRALVTILPVANLWAAVFDLAPKIFDGFFERLAKVFSAPIVRDSESYKTRRRVSAVYELPTDKGVTR